MERLILTLVILAGVLLVAWGLRVLRADRGAPTQVGHTPTQLDRSAFVGADAPWLIAVFSSATCAACAAVLAQAVAHESPQVAVQEVEVGRDPALHQQYRIDSVPTTVVADRDGVVRGAWIGPLSVTDKEDLAQLLG